MDDLVRLGTIALVGLAGSAIIFFAIVLILLFKIWDVIMLGDYLTLIRYGAELVLVAGIYLGIGVWFCRAGKI
jgi:hypothetical protein